MTVSDLHRRIIASKKPLLLDAFPNASAAYSLRKLRSAYTGNCIEVRRSSDNTTQNIGFVNNVLDTASLLSFVGAGNGFVRTWYDQTGNNQNGVRTDTSFQPPIVSNGNLLLINNKPSISFPNTGGVRFDLPDATYLNNQTQFFGISVTNPEGQGGTVPTIFASFTVEGYKASLLYSFNQAQRFNVGGRRTSGDAYTGVNGSTNIINSQTLQIGHLNYSLGVASIWINNQGQVNNNNFLIGQMDNTSNITPDNIGGNGDFQKFHGKMQEIVIYNTNQSNNVLGMQSNINSFYNIY